MASSEGFLTDEQRKMLEVAIETGNTEVFSTSPRSPSGLKSPTRLMASRPIKAPANYNSTTEITVRHVRRTHSGKYVRVKKDGGGGKGTWGNILDTGAESCIDRNDPNYDSSEEPYLLVGSIVNDPLDEYKKAVVSLIEEYFSTGDVDVAASDLRELGSGEYHPYFLKRLVSTAMDRHDKEKEMTSVLLSALYADVIPPTQISQGFFMLLECADDLSVDILDAVDILALFVARAVVDDILPPAFITRAKEALPESSKGFQILQTCEKNYFSAPQHAELVERRWGGSTKVTVEKVKTKIANLLKEYVESGDTSKACRCICQLGVTFFHHEVVKKALIYAMEIPAAKTAILKLLKEAAEEGLISSSQMVKGFARLAESLDDLALDIPSAKTLFESLVPCAITQGWLDASFPKSLREIGDIHHENAEKMKRYKEEVVTIIREYFLSDEIPELIQSLKDLGEPEFYPIFLKKLITIAMDRKNKEREMTSVLLSALHIELFSTEDIVNGFVMLLEAAEDTALDVLDASSELCLFLARAVIDVVLDPLNLEEIGCRLPPNCSGSETLDMARSLLAASHSGERILRCWGGGTGWVIEDAKDKIVKLLEEYKIGGILSEACQCIRDLNMPFFNHEVVKKALVMAIKNKNDKMLDLLHECFCEGLITTNQLTKGFTRISDTLDDLALDIPGAEERFNLYVEYAQKKGWLLPSYCSSGTDDPLLPAAIETGNAEVFSTSPVKKDGAGGKGMWGKLLDPDCESPIDRNDPNYDRGEEQDQLQRLGNELSPTSFLRKCKSQNVHKSVLEVFMEFIKARERPVDEIEVESYEALSCCIQGNSELEPNNIEVYEFLAEIIPSKEELQERRELIVSLTSHIKEIWPNAKVVPYGSFGSGLSLKKSDIDLTIFKDGLFKDESGVWTMGVGKADATLDLLYRISHLMREKKMLQVQRIDAKVPIVRFVNPNPRIDVDISLNGIDGFLNTKLLSSIQTFDQRIPNLCALVKNWARVNDLNKTWDGGLSSYSYNLMVMNFCQMRGIALVLHHESMNTFKVKIGEEICGFRELNSGDMANKTNNRMTLFELLKSFFRYWAREYNYWDDVVSVRMGKTIRRKESQCAGNARKETIVIEDPFMITKNVCFHLHPNQLEKMRKEFVIAAQLLERSAKSWIDKYRPSFI